MSINATLLEDDEMFSLLNELHLVAEVKFTLCIDKLFDKKELQLVEEKKQFMDELSLDKRKRLDRKKRLCEENKLILWRKKRLDGYMLFHKKMMRLWKVKWLEDRLILWRKKRLDEDKLFEVEMLRLWMEKRLEEKEKKRLWEEDEEKRLLEEEEKEEEKKLLWIKRIENEDNEDNGILRIFMKKLGGFKLSLEDEKKLRLHSDKLLEKEKKLFEDYEKEKKLFEDYEKLKTDIGVRERYYDEEILILQDKLTAIEEKEKLKKGKRKRRKTVRYEPGESNTK